MILRSSLFLLVLGLLAVQWTAALPIELVDLEHMRTEIVDSSKAAEIIDDKDSDIDDTIDDAEKVDEFDDDADSAKKASVPVTPNTAVATEGEESPAKKQDVLDDKKEAEVKDNLISEIKKASDDSDDVGKRDYGWGGNGGGGGYGGYGGGGHGGGHHGGYGGYGHGEHGQHGHHEHGHDHHDHGYEFYEEYDDHHGGHHGGHEGGHEGGHGGHGGYGGYGGGGGHGGHGGHGHEGHEHGHHGHHAGYRHEWGHHDEGEHGGHGGSEHGGHGGGHHGGGGWGGYKKEEIKKDEEKPKAKKEDNKKQGKKVKAKAVADAKEADKDSDKEAEKTEEKAQVAAVPVQQPGQQAQAPLNWGNLKLTANGKQGAASTPVDKSHGSGIKNWWKVGDGHVHWGHDHWGSPHHVHHGGGGWEYGHTGMKHGHGHYRDEVPDCSDPETATTNKRCLHGGFGHHGGGYGHHGGGSGHHGDGYHFVDQGNHHGDNHGGHHHDYHLRGPWTFGYDDFGDDWADWDHNHHNFDHLSHLEHPHEEHGHGHGGHGYGKDDVPAGEDAQTSKKFHLVPINPYYGGWGFPTRGYGYGVGRGYGYGGHNGGHHGGHHGSIGYWPVSYGIGRGHHGFGHHGVLGHFSLDSGCIGGLYRNGIEKGGSKGARRCLFGRVGHPLGGWYGWGSWPWGGYGDFVGHGSFGGDVGGGHHGYFYRVLPVFGGRNILFGKGGIPKAQDQEAGASGRQGVVYPYVGYGPWSSYPWWADWWGGHGHHGWGSGRGGGHGGGHGGFVGLGGHGGGHGGGLGGGLGGGHGGGHGVALHCRDVVPSDKSDNAKSKRFCVPIGYHGGYGWPFWHGYPGAGLGQYGWGWPWYKSKVPKGKKTADEPKKAEKKPEEEEKKDTKDKAKDLKATQRDQIPSGTGKQEKKQTIHVGYGYASGDNYRLGYGFGGMGGVNGFNGHGNQGGVNLDDGHAGGSFKKSELPSQKESSLLPESDKQVTATKRHFGGGHMGGENNPGFGYAMPYGHPVTHPGFTTVAWPGHAITTNDIKNMIPKAPVKVKRQIMGGAENFQGMMPMAAEQPFPQEQEPEMMGPGGYPDQAAGSLLNGPSDGYPTFPRAFIPMVPRSEMYPRMFAPGLFSYLRNDDSTSEN